jgi:hypothetical protein
MKSKDHPKKGKDKTTQSMNIATKFEDRVSSSPSTHEGEPSESLCDRLSRTRDTSQRQLPTDQDYAVSTREYQTDQSSLKTAQTAAGPVLEKQQTEPKRQKQPRRFADVDWVTPYQRFRFDFSWGQRVSRKALCYRYGPRNQLLPSAKAVGCMRLHLEAP